VLTPLLDISVTPIEIHVNATPAKLEYDNTLQPIAKVHTTNATLSMQTTAPEMRIDTYEARKSIGLENSGDFARDIGQRGMQALSKRIGEIVQDGNQMADTANGVRVADIIRQKMLEQPELVTTFLPTGGADVSFQAGDLKMQVQPGDINCDWGKMGCEQHYTPATMEFEVVQRPEIHFEYLGRPAYVPPSADPEYEAEE